MLTELGVEYVEEFVANIQSNALLESNDCKPEWNREIRELLFEGSVIKRFPRAATAQEPILNSFEDAGWPAWILDPLPLDRDPDECKRRLKFAIFRLNQQDPPTLRFRSLGDSKIAWHSIS